MHVEPNSLSIALARAQEMTLTFGCYMARLRTITHVVGLETELFRQFGYKMRLLASPDECEGLVQFFHLMAIQLWL